MDRSKSCSDKSSSNAPAAAAAASATGLRCYSASYVTSKNAKLATTTWPSSSASPSAASVPSTGSNSKARTMWSGAPSELRRKRRVAGYRVYAVEDRVKVSLKSGARWLKSKCTRMVDGWW